MQSNTITYTFVAIDDFSKTVQRINRNLNKFKKHMGDIQNAVNRSASGINKDMGNMAAFMRKRVDPDLTRVNKNLVKFKESMKITADQTLVANEQIAKSFTHSATSINNFVSKTGRFKMAFKSLMSYAFPMFAVGRSAYKFSAVMDPAKQMIEGYRRAHGMKQGSMAGLYSLARTESTRTPYSQADILSAESKLLYKYGGDVKSIAHLTRSILHRYIPNVAQFADIPLGHVMDKIIKTIVMQGKLPFLQMSTSSLRGKTGFGGKGVVSMHSMTPRGDMRRFANYIDRNLSAKPYQMQQQSFNTVMKELMNQFAQLSYYIGQAFIPSLRIVTSIIHRMNLMQQSGWHVGRSIFAGLMTSGALEIASLAGATALTGGSILGIGALAGGATMLASKAVDIYHNIKVDVNHGGSTVSHSISHTSSGVNYHPNLGVNQRSNHGH